MSTISLTDPANSGGETFRDSDPTKLVGAAACSPRNKKMNVIMGIPISVWLNCLVEERAIVRRRRRKYSTAQ